MEHFMWQNADGRRTNLLVWSKINKKPFAEELQHYYLPQSGNH